MKKIILVLVAGVCSFQLWSQGTLRLTSGAYIKTTSSSYLVLDNMHIVNDGSFQQTSGNGFVKLIGGMNVNFTSSTNTIIDQFLMAKTGPATFNLLSNLSVLSIVNFSGGLLNLNNNVLDLGTTGIFSSESETSRAFTTGTGYIQATGILNNPSSANLGNLGAVITSSTNLGNTTIRRGHKVQTVSGSNNSIQRFYDIIPMNNMSLKATLRFYYFDAELNGLSEATLSHWKSSNQVNWSLVGADSRDVNANYVERKTYSSFDRVTLAAAASPVITCPANKTVSATISGCKASVAFAATATGSPTPSITYKVGNSVVTSPYVFSKGTTTVTATASNGISPDATCTFTVTVVCGPVANSITSTEKITDITAENLTILAMPNPSSNKFIVIVQGNKSKDKIHMQVVDIAGRIVEERIISGETIKLGDRYRAGIYIARFFQGKQHKELKLVKLPN